MKNTLPLLRLCSCLLFIGATVSCSIDNAYDLSKDVDMTVSVGKGAVLPLGSTEKIMLTEMIDPMSSELICVDALGYYSLVKKGVINETTFDVEDTDLNIDQMSDVEVYDFTAEHIKYDNIDELPEDLKQAVLDEKFPYIIYETIDESSIVYTVDESVPEEIKRIKRLTFKKPVTLTIDLDIYASSETKIDFDRFSRLHLLADDGSNEEKFYITVPPYMCFAEGTPIDENNRLYVEGIAEHKVEKGHKHFITTCEVVALDFSCLQGGFLEVNNGNVYIRDSLEARGLLSSDTIIMDNRDIREIKDITVHPSLSVETIYVDSVYGVFEPEIDEINEVVAIELGEDLDFLYEARMDFSNPQLYVTVNNDAPLAVVADVELSGYDKSGALIDGSSVYTKLNIDSKRENRFCLSRVASSIEEYTSVHVPNLNNLMTIVPEEIAINLNAYAANSITATPVKLGESMSIAGEYELCVPLAFESFEIDYTEVIDNVLGDDSEDFTDKVSNLKSVTLEMVVDNTVPAEFVVDVKAYKEDGVTLLDKINAVPSSKIAAGSGYVNGELAAPVETMLEINLAAADNQLLELHRLEIVFSAKGSSVLNVNEYIKLRNMKVRIDENVDVDLN